MRLQPVAANSLRRVAVRDVRLSNGVVLPAGVSIEVAQYSNFRNPAWGWKDPNAYLPVSSLSIKSHFYYIHQHLSHLATERFLKLPEDGTDLELSKAQENQAA